MCEIRTQLINLIYSTPILNCTPSTHLRDLDDMSFPLCKLLCRVQEASPDSLVAFEILGSETKVASVRQIG